MKEDKRKKLEANTKNLLELLGEDPSREGLINTPKRVAKAWDFLTKGYSENLDELINNAIFEGESKDMVCLLYTSPSPRDEQSSRMPSSA